MDLNNTERSTKPSINIRSVIQCPQASNFKWDLKDTTIIWILFPITSFASLAAIFFNAMVILAVKQKKELKKTSTILLSSMAIADLLVGAISMPLTVAADILIIRQVSYPGFCTLRLTNDFFMFSFVWASLNHLTIIAWERYVAIRKSMDYKALVKRKRIRNLAIVAWVLAAVIAFPPLVMVLGGVDQKVKESWHIGESVVSTLCLIINTYCYIMIYLGVRNRKLDQITQVAALVKAKRESKVAVMTGTITAALIISFVPLIVVGGLREIFRPVPSVVFRLPEIFIHFNSVVNPLIYCYRDRRFRKGILELLRINKTAAVQPDVGEGKRLPRRKDSLGSLDVPGRQKADNQNRLTRTASCVAAVNSDCVHQTTRKMLLERSMSAPTLDKCSIPFHGTQFQQPSSIVTTTAITHAESVT